VTLSDALQLPEIEFFRLKNAKSPHQADFLLSSEAALI
jgi:hypothetical protein